jgi:SAM-dependent methyltransferase
MNIGFSPRQIYSKWREWRNERGRNRQLKSYILNGRKPWSEGYILFKENFLKQSINDKSLLEIFRNGLSLPKHYGEFLDERVVEYPWFISRIKAEPCRLLDAGSVLNFDYILKHSALNKKDITIVNLEPEITCYWLNRVSYLFGDIRNLPLRDNWFDEVVSISTIEHIGLDNTIIYSKNMEFKEKKNLDFLKAVSELKRVTKKGGKVYITVPYGKFTDFGWYQQFDIKMIDLMIDTFAPEKLVETYYCYESGCWQISDKQYCQKFEGFNIHDTKYFNPNSTKDYAPDYAACSRAIAALELWK